MPDRRQLDRKPRPGDLIDTAGIAKLMGITTRSLSSIRCASQRDNRRVRTLPEPICYVSRCPVWWAPEIAVWIAAVRRERELFNEYVLHDMGAKKASQKARLQAHVIEPELEAGR